MWPLNSLMLWHHVLLTALSLSQAPRPFVVVLDPGHGGTEKGACRPGTNSCEKDLTLNVARQAAQMLASSPDIRVLLTRNSDRHVPLYDRMALAGKVGADLLVSIHANASPKRNETGYEIYVYPDEPRIGEPVIDDVGDEASVTSWSRRAILADLRRQGLGKCSRAFGSVLRAQMRRRLGRKGDRGLLTGEMAVLAGASTPSVLFEIGFIDHPAEGRRLEDPAYQRRIVMALVLAVRRWAHKAQALGCRPTRLSHKAVRLFPGTQRSQGQRPAIPKILRRNMQRSRHRELVVSADPRWTRNQEQ